MLDHASITVADPAGATTFPGASDAAGNRIEAGCRGSDGRGFAMPAEPAPGRHARAPGRVAVVTGASRGFGAELARRLGLAGWTVITVSRTPRCAAAGPGSRHVIADAGSADATGAVVEALCGRPLQLLVNNAG